MTATTDVFLTLFLSLSDEVYKLMVYPYCLIGVIIFCASFKATAS